MMPMNKYVKGDECLGLGLIPVKEMVPMRPPVVESQLWLS